MVFASNPPCSARSLLRLVLAGRAKRVVQRQHREQRVPRFRDDGLGRLPVWLRQPTHMELLRQLRRHGDTGQRAGRTLRGACQSRHRRSSDGPCSCSLPVRSARSSANPPDPIARLDPWPNVQVVLRDPAGNEVARATADATGVRHVHRLRVARTTSSRGSVGGHDGPGSQTRGLRGAGRADVTVTLDIRHGHSMRPRRRIIYGRMAVDSAPNPDSVGIAGRLAHAAQPGHARPGHEGDAALPDARDRRAVLPAARSTPPAGRATASSSRRTSSSAPRPARSPRISSRTSSAA